MEIKYNEKSKLFSLLYTIPEGGDTYQFGHGKDKDKLIGRYITYLENSNFQANDIIRRMEDKLDKIKDILGFNDRDD